MTQAALAIPAQKGGRQAILETAERLFGQHGIDGVSLRQINLAAGMGNNSAIAYHFGDRAGLIRAIYEWRLPALERVRARLLEEAQAEGQTDDPAPIIGIMVRPFLELVEADGRRVHAMFMHQMMRSPEGRAIRIRIGGMTPLSDWARARLSALIPDVPRPLLEYRMRLGTITFLDAVEEWERSGALGFTVETLLDEQLSMMAAICALPLSQRVRTHFEIRGVEG
jgi:AcrR family transcriptional regulator